MNADVFDLANISKDLSAGTNVFAYCHNNPINNRDPSGHAVINVVCAIIGAIVGWSFGAWIAKRLGYTKGKKYYAIRAGVTLGGAAIGWFAGSLMTRLVSSYLRANLSVVFRMISKVGPKRAFNYLKWLGINPIAFTTNGSKFISLLKQFNSKAVIFNTSWALTMYNKARQLGYRVVLDKPHGGYSYHAHIVKGSGGRISGLHIQLTKAAYDYLRRLIG